MKHTMKWTVLAVALLAASGAGVAAQQQMKMRHGGAAGMPPGPRHAHLEAMLDLTDAQKASLKAVHEEQRQAAEPVFEELRGLHEAIEQALESGAPDATAIGEKTIAAHAARKRLEQLHAAGREKLVALLTDEQREKFEAFEKQHGEMGGPGPRMRMRGPGPGHGGPMGPPQAR
jgi:Spy/CpxP family protein refolding chaperone